MKNATQNGVACAGALALAILQGCNSTHVVYVHDATLGIAVQTAAEGTGKIVVGFDRETFGLVPTFDRPQDENNPAVRDAMTVTAISRVHMNGLDNVEFGHVVATGTAAEQLATSPETLKTLADRVFNKTPAAAPKTGGDK